MMQASPSSGAVDVYLTAQGASIGGSSPILSNFQFGQVAPQYAQESATTVEVQVTPYNNPSKVLYTGVFTGVAGDIYTGYFLDPPITDPSKGYSLLLVKDPTLTSTTSGS